MKKLRKANSTKSVDFLNIPEKSVRAEYTSKFSALTKYIQKFVDNPEFKQAEIAEKLEMHESQVSVWLSGFHNLTLKSILKLESACDIQILNPVIWNQKQEVKSEYLGDEIEYSLTAYNFFKSKNIPNNTIKPQVDILVLPDYLNTSINNNNFDAFEIEFIETANNKEYAMAV